MGTNLAVERAIRSHLHAQHGLITLRQARAAGLSRKALRHRVATGRFVVRWPAVYADAAVPQSWHQEVLAAVLAAGPTAFASHSTAAQVRDLEPRRAGGIIEVTTVLERDPKIAGIRAHRSGLLLDHDIEMVEGIPVSSVARLILDLSGRSTVAVLGRLTDEALRRRLTTYGRIAECLARLPRAPGRSPKTVREVLATRVLEMGPRESWLEEFVFDALVRYGLPLPATQVIVTLPSGRRRLDKCYIDAKLVLEGDGFSAHSMRSVFDDDRRRNNELLLAGYRVLRFTSEFTDHQIACTVAAALGVIAPEPAQEGPLSFKQWFEGRRVAPCSARGSDARSER